jgi:hypothetical protein
MSRACSTYGGRAEVYAVLWWGNLRDIDLLEESGVDRRIILMELQEVG